MKKATTPDLKWFENARNLRIRHDKQQFNFNFMPHSLIISRMAVCLYLHNMGKRIVEKLGPTEPLLMVRLVDDIMIISTSAKELGLFQNF